MHTCRHIYIYIYTHLYIYNIEYKYVISMCIDGSVVDEDDDYRI